jgi:hypothetical protein
MTNTLSYGTMMDRRGHQAGNRTRRPSIQAEAEGCDLERITESHSQYSPSNRYLCSTIVLMRIP